MVLQLIYNYNNPDQDGHIYFYYYWSYFSCNNFGDKAKLLRMMIPVINIINLFSHHVVEQALYCMLMFRFRLFTFILINVSYFIK